MSPENEDWKIHFFSAAVVAIFLGIILLLSGGVTPQNQSRNQINSQNSSSQYGSLSSYLSDLYSQTGVPGPVTSDNSAGEEQILPEFDAENFSSPLPPTYSYPSQNQITATAEIVSPKSEEILVIGETYPIRWKLSDDVKTVRLVLYEVPVSICGYDKSCLGRFTKYVANYDISQETKNTGVFNWRVGRVAGQYIELPAAQYNLRIETPDGIMLGDSYTFAVTSKSEPVGLKVEVPYDPADMPYPADPVWFSTQEVLPYGIVWNSSPSIFRVDIFVRSRGCGSGCREGSGLYQIASAIPNGLLWGWYPVRGDVKGTRIPAGDYEMYIQDADNPAIKSEANIFNLE